jgi:putative DNA primase/helicase
MPTSNDNLSAKATLFYLKAWRENPNAGFPPELFDHLPEKTKAVVRETERKLWIAEINSISKANVRAKAKTLLTAEGTAAPDAPLPLDWLCDSDEFLIRQLPERKPYLVDSETGGVFLYEKSLNQIFATRGLGKSVAANALLRPLLVGGNWLNFYSDGGYRVVLLDAELPKEQLQERIREFTGTAKGQLKIISPELMPDPKRFPVLIREADREELLRQIAPFQPHILIFDTLTSCFRFDTNDPEKWLSVNEFLMRLRFLGYCIIIIHHAGKNGTQRGRTDGDDNLDVTVQLNPRDGWEPGQGLQFKWEYGKVRHGGYLEPFEAGYTGGGWVILEDERIEKALALSAEGKSQREIAKALDMKQPTVCRLLRKAKAKDGLLKLNRK